MKKLLFLVIFLFSSICSSAQDSLFVRLIESVGFYGSTWISDNSKNALGHPGIFGATATLGKKKHKLHFYFDLIGFGKPRGTAALPPEDTLAGMKKYWIQQMLICYGHDLLTRNDIILSAEAGLGYGHVKFSKDRMHTALTESFLLSAGAGFRYRLTDRYHLKLKLDYCFADYSLNSLVSLEGNYIQTRLIFGFR